MTIVHDTLTTPELWFITDPNGPYAYHPEIRQDAAEVLMHRTDTSPERIEITRQQQVTALAHWKLRHPDA